MAYRLFLFCALVFLVSFNSIPSASQKKNPSPGQTAPAQPRDYPVKPVPFTSVHFNDRFWAPRLDINRRVTIPFAFKKDEETKRVYNFERAAAVIRGEAISDRTPPGYPFDDTDVYKVIEGAAYSLNVQPDA